MKTIVFYFGIIISSICILSCNSLVNSNKSVEEKFRTTIAEDGQTTYERYFAQLAGLRGEVKYKVFMPQGELSPDVKVIQVDIDKKVNDANYKTALLQYKFNVKTGFVDLVYIEINGKKAENLITGMLDLGFMMMESVLE